MSSFTASITLILVLSLLLASNLSPATAQPTPPLADGLSFTFHSTDCPTLETIIRDYLTQIFSSDIGQAAGLLRIHFHDYFVQGCDASVLLDGSARNPFTDEQDSVPNLTLRAQGFIIIEELRRRVHEACGQIVSCADITALAARDSVFLSGGPDYQVPLGRQDGLTFATDNDTVANLPPFFFTASQLIDFVAAKGLDATDLVAISGGHTIGRGNCGSFIGRLDAQDPTMEPTFVSNLRQTCPTNTTVNTTVLDIQSPNIFDNGYYIDLMNRQGLFTSDQDLFTNETTSPIVTNFAANQTLFFESFAFSIIKMGMMNVTTGTQGEIRANCSRPNSAATFLSSMVIEEEGESATF